jgi:hypothetical protein
MLDIMRQGASGFYSAWWAGSAGAQASEEEEVAGEIEPA